MVAPAIPLILKFLAKYVFRETIRVTAIRIFIVIATISALLLIYAHSGNMGNTGSIIAILATISIAGVSWKASKSVKSRAQVQSSETAAHS